MHEQINKLPTHCESLATPTPCECFSTGVEKGHYYELKYIEKINHTIYKRKLSKVFKPVWVCGHLDNCAFTKYEMMEGGNHVKQ